MDVRVVEAEEVKGDGFHGGVGFGVEGERDDGEVVESDGRSGSGDVADVGGGGAGVEGRGGGEDGDGERRVVVEYKLAQLHH